MTRKKTSLSSTIKTSPTDPDTIEKLVEQIHGSSPQILDESLPEPLDIKQDRKPSKEKGRREAPKKKNEVEYDPIVTTSFKLPKSLLKEIKRKAIDDEITVGEYLVSLIEKDIH